MKLKQHLVSLYTGMDQWMDEQMDEKMVGWLDGLLSSVA